MAIAAVVAMYAAFMLVGWIASRKVREGTAADLIVAGRQMPLWVAALTMTATWVDGGYLLGTTEGAYKSSIQLGVQGGLCFGISLIIGGALFAGVMRRFGFTAPDLHDFVSASHDDHVKLFFPAVGNQRSDGAWKSFARTCRSPASSCPSARRKFAGTRSSGGAQRQNR